MGFQYFLFVALGGGLGSILRAFIPFFLPNLTIWSTAVANLLGALIIGILIKVFNDFTDPVFLKAFWIVGFCGGFTTFSTFGMDFVDMINSGNWLKGWVYAGINFLGTITFIFIGYRIGDFISPS